MSVVTLTGVSKSFGRANAIRKALDAVSLDITPGEWIALLGPNGSGKSTLMRIITGELAADQGEVHIGFDKPRAKLGVVFQKPALDRQLTVRENLDLAGALFAMPAALRRSTIEELANALGFTDRLTDRVRTLSGGLARRVDLARALMHDPKLLMLDEPTSGLDPEAREVFLDEIARRQTAGLTVIMATHLMSDAERAGRVLMLAEGKLIADGSPAQLCTDLGALVLRADATDAAIEVLTQLPASLHKLGREIMVAVDRGEQLDAALSKLGELGESFRVAKPSLIDVYVANTGSAWSQEGV